MAKFPLYMCCTVVSEGLYTAVATLFAVIKMYSIIKEVVWLQQQELEHFLLVQWANTRSTYHILPPDIVFDMMVNVGMGTWYNLLCAVLTNPKME